MTDPVSDMLIRLKNAQGAGKGSVLVSYSKFKQEIAKVLEISGLIAKMERRGKKVKKTLEIVLNPKDSPKAISGVKLISKPSLRLYAGFKDIGMMKGHGGVLVVSTSKGVMSGKEAFKSKLGGQLIAEVW